MKFRLNIKCNKCKSKKVILYKEVNYSNENEIFEGEMLLHNGYKCDLNTFKMKCSECGSEDFYMNVVFLEGK